MVQCEQCDEYGWPPNFEGVLEQAEGCPACNPEAFMAFPKS